MMSNTNSRSEINPYRRFQASSMEKIVVEGRSSSDVVTKNDYSMQNFSKPTLNSDQQQQHQQIYSTSSSSVTLPNSSVIGNSLYSSSDQSQACSLIDWPAASSSNSNINKKLESSPKKKKPPLRKMNLPFPWKLQKLLDDLEREGRQHIASWSPSGRSFRVHKPDEFSRDVMGHYFRQTKYNSFTRQLYIYGFSKIENGPEVGSFHHPSFLRDVKPEALTIGRNECNQDRRCKRKTKSFDASTNSGGSNGEGKRSLAERKSLLIDYYKNLYSSSNTSNPTSATSLPSMASKNDSSSNVRALAPARMRTELREGAVSSFSAPDSLYPESLYSTPVHPYGSQRNTTIAVHPTRSSHLHLLDKRMGIQLDSIYGDHHDNSNRTSRMITTSTNGSSLLGQVPDLETGHHKNNTVTTYDDYGSSDHDHNVAEASARRLSLSSLQTITSSFLPQDLLLDQGLTSKTSLIQDEKQQTQSNIHDNSSRRDDMTFDDDLSWLNLPSSSPRKEGAVDEILFVQKNPPASFDTASNDTVGGRPREVGYDAMMNDMLEPRTIEEMMSEQ